MEVFEIKQGKLNIKNSAQFIQILINADIPESKKFYKMLHQYALKQMHSLANDIPYQEWDAIINFAIVKTIRDFEPGKSNLTSFFWEKLRGEITSYKYKRNSLQKKVLAAVNQHDYAYQKNKDNTNSMIAISDDKTLEEQMLEEDFYHRQIKAFKLAFSGIPRILQQILYLIGEGKHIQDIANLLHMDKIEVSKKRNQGLSLILQRILRSHHLTEEEKKELAKLHNISYE